MIHWRYCKARIQGRRPYQEDYDGVFTPPPALGAGELVLVVADGMGGEHGGDRASQIVVSTFIDAYAAVSATTIPERLQCALLHANRELAFEVAEDPAIRTGMGCTVLAVVFNQQELYWISVGDSPLWVWRRQGLTRLNQDHSYRYVLAQRVAAGELSEEVANRHPDRTALLSAVTGSELNLIDLCKQPYPLQKDDQILLASDGLFTLTEEQIALQMANREALSCQRLLNAVVTAAHPYQDNATVMIAQAGKKSPASRRKTWLMSLLIIMLTSGMVGFWWWTQGFADLGGVDLRPQVAAPPAKAPLPPESRP
jgi:protein phosphatase